MMRFYTFFILAIFFFHETQAQRQWTHGVSVAFMKPAPMESPVSGKVWTSLPTTDYYEKHFEQLYAPSGALSYVLTYQLTPSCSFYGVAGYVVEQQYFRQTIAIGSGTSVGQFSYSQRLFRTHHIAPKFGIQYGFFNHPGFQLFAGVGAGFNFQLGGDEIIWGTQSRLLVAPNDYSAEKYFNRNKLREYRQREENTPNRMVSHLIESKIGIRFQSHQFAFVINRLVAPSNRGDEYAYIGCEGCLTDAILIPLDENMLKKRMDWRVEYQYDF